MRQIAATRRRDCNKSPRVTCENHRRLLLFCHHEFKLVWIRATYRSDKIRASDLSQQQCRRGDVSPQFVASVSTVARLLALRWFVAATCRGDLSHRVSRPSMLRPGQTDATCWCSIIQHCWIQHVALVWPPCCTMLHDVGWCWTKFDFHQTSSSTSSNISFVLKCEQICCIRLATVFNIVERAHAR